MINVKKIVMVILTFVMVTLFTVPALAADLNEVTFADSKITVSGRCTTSDQVQVIVFDYNNQPIFFSTVDVVQNSFSKTLDAVFDLEEGKTYTVKIADYNGKNVSTGTFTVESENTNHWRERVSSVRGQKETAVIAATGASPQTGDTGNMIIWISLLFFSGCTLATLVSKAKLRKQNER